MKEFIQVVSDHQIISVFLAFVFIAGLEDVCETLIAIASTLRKQISALETRNRELECVVEAREALFELQHDHIGEKNTLIESIGEQLEAKNVEILRLRTALTKAHTAMRTAFTISGFDIFKSAIGEAEEALKTHGA